MRKQAFLIVSDNLSKRTIDLYDNITEATREFGDVILLYHSKKQQIPQYLKDKKIVSFNNDILTTLKYKPLENSFIPGSNHFPVFNFYLEHTDYDFYWCIENDVLFNGNWLSLFRSINMEPDYDFITSHIQSYSDKPGWWWWYTWTDPRNRLKKEDLYCSLNPVFRMSNRALKYVDECLKKGYAGHHEVVLPTLMIQAGFKTADLGSEKNGITPILNFCTTETLHWKALCSWGKQEDKLYHPVKGRTGFLKQRFVLRKRKTFEYLGYIIQKTIRK